MKNLKNEAPETIERQIRPVNWSRLLVALLLVAIASIVPLSTAAGQTAPTQTAQQRVIAGLAGTWVATLHGNTGCGSESILVTFKLDALGKGDGTATLVQHTSGCGNVKKTGENFNITLLKPGGRGTAGLSCGNGCGWTFNIIVSRDHEVMSLVDVSDPSNLVEGTAIKQ